MPFSFKPYDPPPISNLRERLLQSKLDQVVEYEKQFTSALKASIDRGLSPSYIAVNQQELAHIKTISTRLRDGLETVKQQDAAARKTEARLRDDDAFTNNRYRGGFYRSSNDRNAAIEGVLQRERRQNAPLTREAWSRAKAIAASRRSYSSIASQLRGQRGSQYVPSARDLAQTQTDFDPCVDQKRVRREVMFAQRTAGIGYRTKHVQRPC